MGPEQNMSVLADQMAGINWDGTGVGYGVRGSNLANLTVRLGGKQASKHRCLISPCQKWLIIAFPADIIDLYRHKAPLAPIVFDYSPNTAHWAILERLPLASNCSNSPGKDLVM